MSLFLRSLVGVTLLAPALLGAQQSARFVDLDSGWSYLERADRAPTTLPPAGDRAWQHVTLPHTWNALDATDVVPGYRRDGSWYRRSLDVSDVSSDARLLLAFEGANTVADVWVNGRRAGGHVGGYVGFNVDITPYVNRRAGNEVLVRVDNRDDQELIPSQRSDFVIYGGLTRDVRLAVVPPVAIGHLLVTTPMVQRDSARATAVVELANPGGARKAYSIRATLADPDGRVVATAGASGELNAAVAPTFTLPLGTVRAPKLWSPASPALYRLSVRVTTPGWVETRDEKVGFRWYEFQEHGPFMLNGERLLLRGTHRHEEIAGQGAALTNAPHRADMAAIKALGANFVRLAHYPHDPEIYRAADSLGLLLWDELPWDRGGVGDSAWKANTTRLLREQIRQNANHPSIILWSLGNEVQDVIEEGHAGDTPSLRAFMTSLRAVARELDPSRPTSTRKFDAGADVVDVYSPSIWAGWYGGGIAAASRRHRGTRQVSATRAHGVRRRRSLRPTYRDAGEW
jgi:Beta-galactosidase/beta-glucuronidase